MAKRYWYSGQHLLTEEPRVPVQTRDDYKRYATLPEALVRLAHEEYARHHDQSFERLHQRGGFGIMELVMLLADHVEYLKEQVKP